MNLVFRISEDGSEVESKHCAASKTSVKSSQKYISCTEIILLKATKVFWGIFLEEREKRKINLY